MEFIDVIDPFEAAAEAMHQEWVQEQGGQEEDDFLAADPRNFDTREWDGEEGEEWWA